MTCIVSWPASCSSCIAGTAPRLWSEQPCSYNEPHLWACQNKEIWGGEDVFFCMLLFCATSTYVIFGIKFSSFCCSACSGGCMDSCGRHADSRAATRGQTCRLATSKGHYPGTGINTHSVKYLIKNEDLIKFFISGWAAWPPESVLF